LNRRHQDFQSYSPGYCKCALLFDVEQEVHGGVVRWSVLE